MRGREGEKTDVLKKKMSFPTKTGDGAGFPDFLETPKNSGVFLFL